MKIELEGEDVQIIAERSAEILLEKIKKYLSNKNNEDPLMTVDELSKYLKVKKSWIYQRVHSKSIKFHKFMYG